VSEPRFHIAHLTRAEVLSLAAARLKHFDHVDDSYAYYEDPGSPYALIKQIAKFSPGDEVYWHESDPTQRNARGRLVNVGEVQDVKLLGFPELPPGKLAISYEVAFPGPEGVGLENHDVLEPDLRRAPSRR
jgi:hypothetical protein